MEGLVVGMTQPEVLQTLVLGHEAVSDDLYLRLGRDRLEIRVQYRTLSVEGLSVAVRGSARVEALGEFKLSLGASMALVLEHEDLVVEESITDDGKVGICTESSANAQGGQRNKDTHRRGYRLALGWALRV
jgi:hypothetical protein